MTQTRCIPIDDEPLTLTDIKAVLLGVIEHMKGDVVSLDEFNAHVDALNRYESL